MKEIVLHQWWQTKNIDFRKVTYVEKIQILDFGKYNKHENGPDFTNAKVKIDDLLWCGAIEIHVKSSDWMKHKHQFDSNYDNVILHVVHQKDCEIYNSKQEWIPTIEIVPFQQKNNKKTWVVCENSVSTVNQLTLINQIEHSVIDRLNRKASLIQTQQMIYQFDHQAIFYLLLFRSFGNKINSNAFEQLFIASYPYLLKGKKQLKSILFGFSGLDFPPDHKEEWIFLAHKYGIKTVPFINWKTKGFFAKSNPKIRLEQLTEVLGYLLNVDLYQMKTQEWLDFKNRLLRKKTMTKAQVDLLFINAVVLFYWWFSDQSGDYDFKERAIDLLTALPSEKNEIIQKWSERGIVAKNAFDSQGLLELKNQKCTFTKCLSCKIGKELL